MEQFNVDAKTRSLITVFQKNEITEYFIYSALARRVGGKNGKILQQIADDERRHYDEWEKYSQISIKPSRLKIFFYLLTARIMGLTFAIKMMENNEEKAEQSYVFIESKLPESKEIIRDEMEHENILVSMIDEERIGYISSMVLGLNDALVELTGALAGLTLALQNARVIGMAGLITGIAAALSMSASEYLSQKSETEGKNPLKAAFYTGVAYLAAVILLVIPYFILSNYYGALAITMVIGILIILIFSNFVAVVKDISFAKFFWEMVLISLGVAAISFFIGWLARSLLGVDV